ncbi:MAG: hypothetical protein H6Q11_396, partial [Acidobacteria bacterium]|nr:hypothetical protein [Acidobacteriota bacterium]
MGSRRATLARVVTTPWGDPGTDALARPRGPALHRGEALGPGIKRICLENL